MSFTVYIILSLKNGRYYVGSSADINKRLKEHNGGKTKSTKPGIPWKIVRVEHYQSRQEAYKRERQIKSYKGGNAFKKLFD